MSNSVRGARYWIRVWWPVVFMVAVIALESTETFGADNTSGPLRFVYQALFGHVTDARWDVIHPLHQEMRALHRLWTGGP